MLRRHSWLTCGWFLSLPLCLPLVGLIAVRAAEPAVKPETPTANPEPGVEAPIGTKFVRLSRDENHDLVSMDSAIVRYVIPELNKPGIVVDLICAVHVGEREYYAALNKAFEQYDAVLYELVAPQGTRVPKGGKGAGDHPLGMLQGGMKNLLGLELQLEQIDYHKDNFVHADMSPEQFKESMKDRGDSFASMFARLMEQAQKPGKKSEANDLGKLLGAMFSPDRAVILRRLMAEQMEDLDSVMSALDGPDGSTIVSDRNQVALDVLVKQVADGKKKLAIFYGAGHMPDMEKHLLADFDAKRQEVRWLKAWDLRTKASPAAKPDGKREKSPAKAEI